MTVSRDNKCHQILFEQGGSQVGNLKLLGKTSQTGTKVRFKADPEIFGNATYSLFDHSPKGYRNPLFLLRKHQNLYSGTWRTQEKKEEVFFYQDGIASFIDYVTIDQQPVGNPIILRGTNNKIETRVALQYTGDYQENIFSYVNLVRTKDGGTHEIGLRTAITRSFNEFARKYNVLKEKDKNFDGVDIREGLTAIIALNIPESLLQFEGQTKSKLGSPAARSAVENVVFTQLIILSRRES